MKKRVWNAWLILFLAKSLTDFVIYYFVAGRVQQSQDYAKMESFIGTSLKLDLLLGVIAIIGTSIMTKKALADGRFEVKYNFWTMAVMALAIAVVNFNKGAVYDTVLFNIEAMRLKEAGEELQGHAVPAITVVYFLLGFAFVFIMVVMGISKQIAYNNAKIEADNSRKTI